MTKQLPELNGVTVADITSRVLKWILLAVLAFQPGMFPAQAETTNLVPVADTFIRNSPANDNYGATTPLLVGLAKEPFDFNNRALLKFDFDGIPTNATILNVTLTIVIALSNTDPCDYDLNRMLVDWSEYEATWNVRSAGTPWLDPGCRRGTEFVSAPSVTAVIDGTVFSSPGMVSDVQRWLNNPGTNFGWMLLAAADLHGTGKQIGSRESLFGPVLTVEYTLSPPPSPPEIYGAALVGNGFRFSFAASSNHSYTVKFSDSPTAGEWNLLTNIAAQPFDRVIHITNTVSPPERYFRVQAP